MKYEIKSGEDLPSDWEGWLWEDAKLIPRGELSMLIGHDGVGKTSIALQLAAQWTKEDEVIYMSMIEDGPEVIKSKLSAYDADLDMCVFQPDRPDGTPDAAWMIPDDLDKIEAYLRATGATMAIFDSLDAHLTASPISHKARLALAAVHGMAIRLKIPVIFLHHFNKGGKSTSIDQAIGGARGIKAAFRSILVWGDPFGGINFEGEGTQQASHALAVHKNSYGPAWPSRPSMVYTCSTVPNPYWEGESVLKFELVDSTPLVSPEDIYSARHQKPESTKAEYVTGRDVAAEAILRLLDEHGGWMPGTELEDKTVMAGACLRTVKGTRANMARHGLIEKRRTGGSDGHVEWRLTERGKEHQETIHETQSSC
jgi:hypothetical protein